MDTVDARNDQQGQAGFTLIELVRVLAATALPRFVDLLGEAGMAARKAMGGTILASANLVYARAVVFGVERVAKSTIDIDGDGVTDVDVAYGYPSASCSNGIWKIMGGGFARGWTWSTAFGGTGFWLTTASLG